VKIRFIEQVRGELPPALRATSLNDGGFINFVHKLFIHSKTLVVFIFLLDNTAYS